jgi:hypothetical protein
MSERDDERPRPAVPVLQYDVPRPNPPQRGIRYFFCGAFAVNFIFAGGMVTPSGGPFAVGFMFFAAPVLASAFAAFGTIVFDVALILLRKHVRPLKQPCPKPVLAMTGAAYAFAVLLSLYAMGAGGIRPSRSLAEGAMLLLSIPGFAIVAALWLVRWGRIS